MEFTPRCPICRSLAQGDANPYRPFCSERCQLVDLGGWTTERYRIPGPSVGDGAEDDGDATEDGSQ